MAQNGRVPGADHPITVEPTTEAVRVSVGDRLVALSTTALTPREAGYPPVRQVPLADVDLGLLRRSGTTTYCPYKGTGAYYDLVLGDEEPPTRCGPTSSPTTPSPTSPTTSPSIPAASRSPWGPDPDR